MTFKLNQFMQKRLYLRLTVGTTIVLFLLMTLVIILVAFRECGDGDRRGIEYKPKYRLMIVVLTHPDKNRVRDTIRKTWLFEKHSNVKHFFAIGVDQLQTEQIETLQSENHKYKDLLLLPYLQDSYRTLTKKVLLSLEFIHDNYDFDFLLKCDDDSIVLVHRVLQELDKWEMSDTHKELYWGFFNGKAQPKKRGPWKENDWNLCDYYLPYAVGGGYVLSYNLVKFVATNANVLRIYNSEDVSMGLWLAPLANIDRKHDVRFDTEYRTRGCSNEYIITHKRSMENIKSMYEHYRSSGTLCSQELRTRMSYNYDWSVPPSDCCTRQMGII